MSDLPIDRSEVAERVVAAYIAVARWSAQEFKRSTRRPIHGGGSSGVTATQLAILALVDASGGLTVSHLAERLDLSVPTVVRAVDALERKLLVARQRSAEDRREVNIAPTLEGREAREILEGQRRQRVSRLLSGMTDEEVQALLIGYEAMARATLRGEEQREAG